MVERILRKTLLVAALVALAAPGAAHAGHFEYSFGFSFTKSTYPNNSFDWNRRFGTSLGYRFNNTTSVEVAYQDITEHTVLTGQQDTTLHDRVPSVDLVLNVTPHDALIRPYFKVGIGQLMRDTDSTYPGGIRVKNQLDAVSGILGVGLNLYVAGQVAIRAEVTTYLDGAKISSWQDNIALNLGFTVYF